MATVTLTGADGTTLNLTVTGPSAGIAQTLAAQLSAAITAAGANLTPSTFTGSGTLPTLTGGQVGYAEITAAAGTVTIPTGYQFVIISAATGVVVDASNDADPDVFDTTGGLTYIGSTTNSNTVVATGGISSITLLGGTTGNSVALGNFADTVTTASSGTITGGIGANVISVGGASTTSNLITASGVGERIILGAGSATVTEAGSGNIITAGAGSVVYTDTGTGNTFFAGSGSDVVTLGGGTSVFQGGTSGSDTVYAGSGTNIVNANGGNLAFQGGSGSTTVYGGTGHVTIFGAPAIASSVSFVGGSTAGVLVAAAGSVTLSAAASSTNDTLWGGTGSSVLIAGKGNDLLVGETGTTTLVGGSGSDIFSFGKLTGGGTHTITNFTSSDRVQLFGYNSAASVLANNTVISGSNTVITLSDNTKITLIGYTSLTTSNLFNAG